MIEHAVHFRRGGWDASCIFLNFNYHIEKPFDRDFPFSTYITIIVPKLLFAESVLDTDHPGGASERHAVAQAG